MGLKNIGSEDLTAGDLVMYTPEAAYNLDRSGETALVVETNINMWGEEVIPSGVKLLWPDGEFESAYSDEVFSVNDSR